MKKLLCFVGGALLLSNVHEQNTIKPIFIDDPLPNISFGKHLQVIMVTLDPKEKVLPFIKSWEQRNHTKWSLPIVVGDTLLHQYFPHRAEPNYVWFAPENRFVAQTSYFFIKKDIMESFLHHLPEEIFNSGYSVDSLYKK